MKGAVRAAASVLEAYGRPRIPARSALARPDAAGSALGALRAPHRRAGWGGRLEHPRGLCSGERPPLDFWLLPETRIGLPDIDEKVDAYRGGPSPAALDDVEGVVRVERHALALNGRVHAMLQSAGTGASERLTSEESVRGCAYLLQKFVLKSFAHTRLGKDTAPVRMEQLGKLFSLQPAGGGDEVEVSIEWELSRRQMPGVVEHEYSLQLFANGTRIANLSDVQSSVSDDNFDAIQEHLGANLSLSKEDFRWLLATVATYPSDDAFDILSAKLC